MKKIFWVALLFWLSIPVCVHSFNGSGFDADDDGDIDADDLAGFVQYYGTLRYYKDYDRDDYSDGTVQYSASQPIDYYLESELTAITGDCDDNNYSRNPGVQEICADGIDNDCDGISDEAECVFNQTWTIDWATLFFPASATVNAGTPLNIYGHVYVAGLTDQSSGCDTHPALIAQVGIGSTTDTTNMAWTTAECNQNFSQANDDEYIGTILPLTPGNYYYVYRFSGDEGNTWSYADLNGLSFEILQYPGQLVVNSN